jgi:Mg2+/Co2+ transporter CorC
LITLSRVEKVRRVVQVLSSCGHNSFPVIDHLEGAAEHFSGLILRHTLLVILTSKKDFQRSSKVRFRAVQKSALLEFAFCY